MSAKWIISKQDMQAFAISTMGGDICSVVAARVGPAFAKSHLYLAASFTQIMYIASLYVANGHYRCDSSHDAAAIVVSIMKDLDAGYSISDIAAIAMQIK